MAPTNQKVSNHIPDDVSFSILSKLPLKSIKRFTCTHKSWAFLLENPNFMNMFCKNFISAHRLLFDDTYLLLKLKLLDPDHPYFMSLLSGERFQNKVKLNFPPPFQENDNDIQIWDYGINGILCLSNVDNTKVVLWDPSTEKFKVLPPRPREFIVLLPNYDKVPPYFGSNSSIHGFGYDNSRDDYKVIRCLTFNEYELSNDYKVDWDDVKTWSDPLWEIYSLRSNSWRKLNLDIPFHYKTSTCVAVYINGVCHWLGETKDGTYLMSFDFSNEVVFTTPLPLDRHNRVEIAWVQRYLVVLNGCIAMITKYRMMTSFSISVLGELGIRESWTKLFTINPTPCIERPIGVVKTADVFFKTYDKELNFIDLSTQTMEEIDIKKEFFWYHITIYKEKTS